MDRLNKILDRVANRRFASENPSNLVKTKRDERLWKKAVLATKKRFGINKSEFEDRHWGYTVSVFKRMKGVDENPSSDDTYKIVREEIVKKKGKTPDEWGTKTKIYSIEKLQKLSRERKLDRVLKGVEPDADGAYHLDIELDENPRKAPKSPVLSQEAIEKFHELADLQRGEPEDAMTHAANIMGGGVLSHAIEHIGDINHRMNEGLDSFNKNSRGWSIIMKKAHALSFSRPGDWESFKKEHEKNMKDNYDYYFRKGLIKYSREEFDSKVNDALNRYADEHAKLPVYNEPQFWAREAAVCLGRQNFAKANYYLQKILSYSDDLRGWLEVTSKYDPDFERKVSQKNLERYGAYHLDIELDENPSCEKAGMSETERTSYNKKHGSNVRPGVKDFKTVEDIRRWGSWARRFYSKKKQKFLENGELTRHACSAPAWGRKAPKNKKEAALIARDGKEALETYQYLVSEGWEIKKRLPEKLRKVLNRRWLK